MFALQRSSFAGGGDEDGTTDDGPGPGQVALRAAHHHRRPGGAAVRRRVRDLRARQRHLPRRGARGGAGPAADLARAERAVDGAGRDRLRQGQAAAPDHGRGELDRPGRAQHGDRGRGGARQPAADPAPLRRHLRQPRARPGAPAGRALPRPDDDRQRRVQGGDPLLGPDQPPGADHRLPAPGDQP